MLALAPLASATPTHPKPSPRCHGAMHASNHGPSHAQAQQDSPTPTSDPELLDPAEFRLQVEFFRKLGYSQREVRAALRKLGLAADTNTVLGELIRNQTAADRDSPPGAPQGGLMLVPRGGTSGRAPGSLPGTPPPPPGEEEQEDDEALKPIVIDGSNVAMSHGNKEVFSCQGIQLAVNYFLERGHKDITVFVPSWRKEQPRPDVPITDQHILRELEKKKIVVFTPSRRVGGKRVVCYDDRFIVKLAHETGGIIVSNDTYRDLQSVRPEWKRCVEEQLLMYSFVNDKFMPPDDPLGRHGPSLENFLRKKPLVPEHKRQPCPYGKKCTYGIKCKFYHQDRAHQSQRSLADELRANAKLSTLKEDNKRAVSPKKMTHTHADLAQGPASLSLEQDLELRLSLDHRGAPKGGHISISENVVLHRGSHPHPHSSRRSTSKKAAANHEWACHERANHNSPPSMDSKPGFHYGSQEPLDSGLGSYESQYSEASRGHGDPHCGPLGGPSSSSSSGSFHRYGLSAHQERQDGHQPCSCCSHQAPAPPPSCLQHYAQGPAPCQPCYTPFGGPLYTSAHLSHPYSLPGGCTFPSQVHHMGQQKYWSDPFHAVPQSRSASSLPTTQDQSLVGPFGDHHHQQATWVTMAPPAPPRQAAPYEAEREEVRKKLQAIFHPYQVDKVMGMLPHVLDPQALAAEILNLRSQGGML